MEEMEASKLIVLEEGVDLAEVASEVTCCKATDARFRTK